MSSTKKVGLAGYSGFVGSNIDTQSSLITHRYNSKNINDLNNQTFDQFIFSACPAKKWLANKDPQQDKQIIAEFVDILKSVKVKDVFILISTIDVYPDVTQTYNEDFDCASMKNHAYGSNRLWFEECVKEIFEKVVIIRLPALFGTGLKKNYIFDLLHDNAKSVVNINPNTYFQWYSLDNLWGDIQKVTAYVQSKSIKQIVVNFFTEPLLTQDWLKKCFPDRLGEVLPYEPNKPVMIHYKLETKYANEIFANKQGKYIRSSEQVLNDIHTFVQRELNVKKKRATLTISNIGWIAAQDDEVFGNTFNQQQMSNFEMALTRIWEEWDDISLDKVKKFKEEYLKAKNISVSSFQAILFKKPDLKLFEGEDIRSKTMEHLKFVVDCAAVLKNENNGDKPFCLVFGAPRNRQIGDRSYDECFDIAVEFFKTLGSYADSKGIIIGMEANPKQYNCNFCYSSVQSAQLVRKVDSPGFRLHLDTACMFLAGDDMKECIEQNKDILCHFHVSEPQLGDFDTPKVDHEKVSEYLANIEYNKFLSIEMRPNGDKSVEKITTAIQYVKDTYSKVIY